MTNCGMKIYFTSAVKLEHMWSREKSKSNAVEKLWKGDIRYYLWVTGDSEQEDHGRCVGEAWNHPAWTFPGNASEDDLDENWKITGRTNVNDA